MLDEYTRSDHWEKLQRASRREAHLRHNPAFTGKRGSADKRRWGGKVPIVDHATWVFDYPCYCGAEELCSCNHTADYENEVGGLHNHQVHFRHWEGKDRGGPDYAYMRRWMKAQVGRPWDDVWSEICTRFDSRSFRGYEIRRSFHDTRLRWSNDVATNVYVSVDDNIRDCQHYSVVHGLYVHPETGILCSTEPEPSYRTMRRRKRFVSDVIGVCGDGYFFVGEYRNSGLHRDYEYRLEDCGSYSKRPDKNKLKTWFRYWDVVTSTPYWFTLRIQYFPVEYYVNKGYTKHEEYGWGEWRWDTKTVHHKKSCTRSELAWIRHALADDFPDAVLMAEKNSNIRPRGGKKRC